MFGSLNFKSLVTVSLLAVSALCSQAQIRDGGIDPKNLGKGVWIYFVSDATNKVGGHIPAVTNVNSLMQFYRDSGIRYCIVKAATNDKLFPSTTSPQFTTNLVNAAHSNGLAIFGYNRSYGSNIVAEVALADFVFSKGADGFVFDAEAEWETGTNQPWITNGPAQAWQLCSQVRSNWPNKFLAHAPFPIIYLHGSFPYKEFGYWCDAVMPQIYHFSSVGIKDSPSAAINWSDVNWRTWQNSLATIPQTNYAGVAVAWTNAIKPILPLQDVYGEVIPGGIINGGAAGDIYPDEDVLEFMDYAAADPHAQTVGGYRGVNFWRTDTIGTNQWANISNGTSGNYSNVVNNIVLDNPSATAVGAWTSVKVFGATVTAATYFGATGTDTNSFGTNYLFKTSGGGAAFVQFTPATLIPGQYDLYQWHPFLTNASAGTPFVIGTPTGTNTVFANQQTNSGNWSLVGRFHFAAGTNNFVRVLDNFTDTTNVAVVDGIKLIYATSDVVLDNTNTAVNFTGSWSSASSATDRFQADYRFANSAASVTATATFRPNFPNAGLYDVFVWHSVGVNRATNAPWSIATAAGVTNVLVNQQVNGGGWLPLALAVPFAAGTNGFVRLANQAGNSVVIADAVKFSFTGPFTPLLLPTLQRQADGRVNLTVNSTPGYGVTIEHTTNLLAWLVLTNLVNTNGTLTFTDLAATNHRHGFYRARQ